MTVCWIMFKFLYSTTTIQRLNKYFNLLSWKNILSIFFSFSNFFGIYNKKLVFIQKMPPQVDPTVSGVLFETDTQTSDLGLDKDVSKLKKATPRKHELVWFNIIWFLYLHIASLYGLWLVFTSAKWQTNVFGT